MADADIPSLNKLIFALKMDKILVYLNEVIELHQFLCSTLKYEFINIIPGSFEFTNFIYIIIYTVISLLKFKYEIFWKKMVSYCTYISYSLFYWFMYTCCRKISLSIPVSTNHLFQYLIKTWYMTSIQYCIGFCFSLRIAIWRSSIHTWTIKHWTTAIMLLVHARLCVHLSL